MDNVLININNPLKIGGLAYNNDGQYIGTFTTFTKPKGKKVYKYLLTCNNKEELQNLEILLFSLEFSCIPAIKSFYIICENKYYYYDVQQYENKWYITTELFD